MPSDADTVTQLDQVVNLADGVDTLNKGTLTPEQQLAEQERLLGLVSTATLSDDRDARLKKLRLSMGLYERAP